MKKNIGKKILLTVAFLVGSLVFGEQVKASGCCKMIYAQLNGLVMNHYIRVSNVDNDSDCMDVCKYFGAIADCMYRDGEKANISSLTCTNDQGCCEASGFAYNARNDAECQSFCKGVVGACTADFKAGQRPDYITNKCTTGAVTPTGCCKKVWVDVTAGGVVITPHTAYPMVDKKSCETGCGIYNDCFQYFRPSTGVNMTSGVCEPELGCCVISGSYHEAASSKEECDFYARAVRFQFSPDYYVGYVLGSDGKCTLPKTNTTADDKTYRGLSDQEKARVKAAMTAYKYDIPSDPLAYAGGNPSVVVGKIINVGLMILGSIALVMFIFAGFTWMTAMGNEAKVATAIKSMVWSVAGLIVIFLSYITVGFLFETATLSGGSGSATPVTGLTSQVGSTATSTATSGSGTLAVPVTPTTPTEDIYSSNLIDVKSLDVPADWATKSGIFPVENNTSLNFVVGKGQGMTESEAGTMANTDALNQIAETGDAVKAGYQMVTSKTVSTGSGNPVTIYYLYVFAIEN